MIQSRFSLQTYFTIGNHERKQLTELQRNLYNKINRNLINLFLLYFNSLFKSKSTTKCLNSYFSDSLNFWSENNYCFSSQKG